ncbi:hypothetical protein G134_1152 [Lactobacillus delbrueckii subsp. lactis CRL581]|nr:hypothetical protein G134_1152 [Lactobacillus delbrueckii subsp. lactis CRL581]
MIFVLPDDLSMKRKNKMVKLENEFHHFLVCIIFGHYS